MTIREAGELERLEEVGRVVRDILDRLELAVRPGITTGELDRLAGELLTKAGAASAPKQIYAFPGNTCISVDDEITHGIPGGRELVPGDVVKLDVTAIKDGLVADSARTVAIPPVSRQKRRLMTCTRAALGAAMAAARAGARVCDVGRAVERVVKRYGFKVIRDLTGHGVGRTIHEEPSIPNFYHPYHDRLLISGMVLALEPLVAVGSGDCFTGADGWTVRTSDRSLAAHFEHTVVIGSGRPRVLTGG